MEFSYKNDRVTIFLDLTTGQIIYKNILKVAISKCIDNDYLHEFEAKFESYVGKNIEFINKSDVNEIRQTINNRISLTKNIKKMEGKENSDMLDNKTVQSIKTFKDMVEGKKVSENDNHLLERHINELMGKMRNQTITPEEQILLDEYISYQKNAELQSSYSETVDTMNKTKEPGRVLRIEPNNKDQAGFVSIVAILGSVIALGILLGSMIITLAFK